MANKNYSPTKAYTEVLTAHDVPSGSVIGVVSDIHLPHHDKRALALVAELFDYAGVSHLIANGDIIDGGPASRHISKRSEAVVSEGTLKRSVARGIGVFDWITTFGWHRWTFGNHERWVCDYISATPEVHGTDPLVLMGLEDYALDVLPVLSRIRLGNRVWEHGDGLFPSGNGGTNPAGRVKQRAPDQITSIGHLHRKFSSFWSTPDERGINRTRGVFGNGHLSTIESHHDYAGSYIDWQQSVEITRVYYVDGRPRFTTDQPEIHRDRRNRPYVEYQGKVFK